MRRPRPWHLLLVLTALIVPLQAGALNEADAPVSMDVSATLDHCGVADTGIVCKIDVSWSGIEEATSYTATVSGPGGVAAEMGTLGADPGGGSASLWVPYEGNGIYSVTVTAWGEEDEDGNKRKLHSEEAESSLEPDRDSKPGSGKPDAEAPEQPEQTGPPAEPEAPAPEPKPEPEPTEPAPAPEPEPAPVPEAPAEPAPEEETPAAPESEQAAPATGSASAEPSPSASAETPAP